MAETAVSPDLLMALRQAVSDVFAIEAVMYDTEKAGVLHLYGRFLTDTASAYPIVHRRFQSLGYVPLFREEGNRQVIRALPGRLPTTQPNVRLAAILLAATVASTLFVGTEWRPERSVWLNLASGLPFAGTLLAILLAHEMGHYLVARRLGIPATLPYFIPMPFNPLGTMGAFIQMKAPPQNRRQLLALGMAGPLAGLILAIPLLVLGLHLSAAPQPSPTDQPYYLLEGNSILYALFKVARFGYFVPDCSPGTAKSIGEIVRAALYGCPPGVGVDVFLHPVAFAAWAGLLVTGLNLIPAGTLDGGHVAYALLGRRAHYLTYTLIAILIGLGFLWWGWFLWAGLIFTLGRRSATPLDDVTRLEPWQVALAVGVLVLFLLTFSPIPMSAIAVPQPILP